MLNWQPINNNIDGIYSDEAIGIVPRHNYLTGQRNYVLATLEQLIGHLNRPSINDDMIKFLSASLIAVAEGGNNRYYYVINEINDTVGIDEDITYVMQKIKSNFETNVLSKPEAIVLKELASMNYNEYLMKGDFQRCDYGAMLTIANLSYQILLQGLDRYIKEIEIFVDTNNVLSSWEFEYSTEPTDTFWLEWTSIDKIDHYSSIYYTNCGGLSKNSINDLASADAIEDLFTNNESKRNVSYNMLVKQYCGVIEQEINDIIQLYNKPNKPAKHLMWKKMKNYVKDNSIELVAGTFELNDLLQDLHDIRNKAAHGEKITEDEYNIIKTYKNRQLFEMISWTKLHLTNKTFEPTVEQQLNKIKK